jgi:hypothetical protein
MTDEWALLRKLASRENISFEAARLLADAKMAGPPLGHPP